MDSRTCIQENEIIRNMMEWRSIRKYKTTQINQSDLDIILEAGLYAPCAGGRLGVIMVACQNSEINADLGRINHSLFHGRMSTAAAYVSKEQPSIADGASIKDGFTALPLL